jgi:release factor glutamine methyltransferase
VRQISAAAPQWMAPRGHLLIETSEGQAPQAVDALTCDGLIPRVARSDELNATVVVGARPSERAPGGEDGFAVRPR